jgi:hypothetical protein
LKISPLANDEPRRIDQVGCQNLGIILAIVGNILYFISVVIRQAVDLEYETVRVSDVIVPKDHRDVDEETAYETARLGRNGVHTPREPVSDRMLAELEAAGDAMLGSELRP